MKFFLEDVDEMSSSLDEEDEEEGTRTTGNSNPPNMLEVGTKTADSPAEEELKTSSIP